MEPGSLNSKVDAYFGNAKPFAQPILSHLREVIHKGCPGVVETIKWSRPFFEYKGVILFSISAFKEHCAVGFWGAEIAEILKEAGVLKSGGMGTFGRITTLEDLPSDTLMLGWIRQAAAFVDSGEHTSPIVARNRLVKAPKPEVETTAEFTAALQKNKAAARVFDAFSHSCKREYIEWIADAKRAETREKRIASAIEWLAEGKQRNWKYQ